MVITNNQNESSQSYQASTLSIDAQDIRRMQKNIIKFNPAYRDDIQYQPRSTGALTIGVEYTNFTERNLWIKTQNNIPFMIEPNRHTVSEFEPHAHLEIKITYYIRTNDTILGTRQALQALMANGYTVSQAARKLSEKFDNLYSQDAGRRNKQNFQFTVIHTVFDNMIDSKSCYHIEESDILLSANKAAITIPHPHSNEGIYQAEVLKNSTEHHTGISVKVVDNENLARVRYYHAGKQLIEVPSVEDHSLQSGVYYSISSRDVDGFVTPKTNFISFKEAEEVLGLYRSREEALTHGDPALIIKAQESENKAYSVETEKDLLMLRRELEKSKAENAILKDSLDLKKTLRDEQYEAMKKQRDDYFDMIEKARKAEAEQHKADLDRVERERRDYYEERSTKRKDWTDWFKFIPAMIAGVLSLFAIFRTR